MWCTPTWGMLEFNISYEKAWYNGSKVSWYSVSSACMPSHNPWHAWSMLLDCEVYIYLMRMNERMSLLFLNLYFWSSTRLTCSWILRWAVISSLSHLHDTNLPFQLNGYSQNLHEAENPDLIACCFLGKILTRSFLDR